MPSDSQQFKDLAKNIREAILAVRKFVYKTMRPDMSKADLRDASDLLKTRKGMCGNFAVLTTTILRAAGIPTRIVAGVFGWTGTFYYRAWCESWDGHTWLGVDSTVEDDQFSAGHLKLAAGNVEAARGAVYFGSPSIHIVDFSRTISN